MAKAVITYNLPEDEPEYKMANNAGKMFSILWDLSQYLREELKYGNYEKDKSDTLEMVRTKFYELMDEENFNLDELA